MDESFHKYLSILSENFASGMEINDFLDYKILKIIETAPSGLKVENILEQLNITELISETMKRMAENGVLMRIGNQFVKPRKATGQIPGMSESSPIEPVETVNLTEASVESVVSSVQTEEVDIPVETVETSVPSTVEVDVPPVVKEQVDSDDIFGSLDSTTSTVVGKKAKDLDFMPSETTSRASLRERAFKTSIDPTEEKSDDVDMDSLFDDVLGESIEEFVADFSDISIEETKAESGLILPLVELLIETGYISNQDEAEHSSEYKLMQTVLENYPISSEDLEKAVNIESLSLMLSNLKADNLVDQTNDYRYTITKKVYKKLKDFIGSGESQEDIDLDRKIFEQYIEQPRMQFLEACLKLSYIDKLGQDELSYNKMPEYEVLRLIRENQPVSSENVKNMVSETLPVVVSRMLSKLYADGVVTTDMNNNYSITTKLVYFMVRDRLKADLDEDTFEEYQQKYE